MPVGPRQPGQSAAGAGTARTTVRRAARMAPVGLWTARRLDRRRPACDTRPMRRRTFLQFAATTLAAPAAADGPRPRIKIGQIGVGHAHATKLAAYRQSPDYEV